MDHQPVCIKVCQCQKKTDCPGNAVCNGCECIEGILWFHFVARDPPYASGCEHCPPGTRCDALTGACLSGNLSFQSDKYA